ncbi:uncharacterized protein LOC142539008 isoform X2 [Primulina tabacum]|uniref:uncharacterized protein LOC142539008 isoform X2 n=1 Tax=Primulina tabacum TaxID=48773 RepID=UPI003F5A12D7
MERLLKVGKFDAFFLSAINLKRLKMRKKSMTMLRKKLFGDTQEFAVLAKFFALLKVLLLELPSQRFPLALTQFDESTSREMKESFDKNVLKHNVASEVSGLLDSFFFVVEGFELSTHEGFCHISLAAGVARFGEIPKFKQREQKLIAYFDRLLLEKDKLRANPSPSIPMLPKKRPQWKQLVDADGFSKPKTEIQVGGLLNSAINPWMYHCCKRCSKKRPRVDFLPPEMVYKVLLHLPALVLRDVMKHVCREWSLMIRSRNFIHDHLLNSPRGLIIQGCHFSCSAMFVEMRETGTIFVLLTP